MSMQYIAVRDVTDRTDDVVGGSDNAADVKVTNRSTNVQHRTKTIADAQTPAANTSITTENTTFTFSDADKLRNVRISLVLNPTMDASEGVAGVSVVINAASDAAARTALQIAEGDNNTNACFRIGLNRVIEIESMENITRIDVAGIFSGASVPTYAGHFCHIDVWR